MMKAPATAAAEPPAASASLPTARGRSRKALTELQPKVKEQQPRDEADNGKTKANIPRSSRPQRGHTAQDAKPMLRRAHGDDATGSDFDPHAAGCQTSVPLDGQSREEDAGVASPMCSPSPVRQLAFQLEHTALEDGPSPSDRPGRSVRQRSKQRCRSSASREPASSGDAAADDRTEGGSRAEGNRGPVLLVLGDELQAMPWESLPGLQSERWALFTWATTQAADSRPCPVATTRTWSCTVAVLPGERREWLSSAQLQHSMCSMLDCPHHLGSELHHRRAIHTSIGHQACLDSAIYCHDWLIEGRSNVNVTFRLSYRTDMVSQSWLNMSCFGAAYIGHPPCTARGRVQSGQHLLQNL